jgi:hypothetical protein
MEFYVLRCEKRWLETNIISGAADAFSLAASPIEKQDETTAAIPCLVQANQAIWARQRSVAGLTGCGCSCADRLWAALVGMLAVEDVQASDRRGPSKLRVRLEQISLTYPPNSIGT